MSDLESLRRKAAADPGDPEARTALFRARFRVEGASAAQELLGDVPTWEAAGEELQDLAIAEVGRILGRSYTTLGARCFEGVHPRGDRRQSRIDRPCFKRRVGVFRYRAGLYFCLIPGGNGLPPFLMGRAPLTDPSCLERIRSEGMAAAFAGSGLRLPSLDEWRQACAGGVDPALYSWDDPPEDSFFRHWEERDRHSMSPGVQNPFGLFGMIGGDWEEVTKANGAPSFCGGSPRALGRIRIRPRHWTLDGYLPDGLRRCYRLARSIFPAS